MNTVWDLWFDSVVLGFLRGWYTPNFIIGSSDAMVEAMCAPLKNSYFSQFTRI